MLTSARRLALLVVLCVVGAGAGSALFASPAFAGGVDTSDGYLNGALYNLTPYTWTKVAQGSPATCYVRAVGNGFVPTSDCWAPQQPPATIAPGGAAGYTVAPNVTAYPVLGNLFSTKFGYDAWVTYRVDVLGGAPEYVTFTVSQCYCTFTYGSSNPRLDVWNTTAPPPSSYDPGTNPASPATPSAVPQITYSHNVPYLYDQTFQIAGNYTVDASTDLGAPFVSVLNTICGSNASACSFTQTSPLKWGIDPAVKEGQALNCTVSQTATRRSSPATAVGTEPPPPPLDPNWFQVEYEAAQSATLTVGGGLTVATEFNLFGTIGGKISVELEAEHEWQEVKTFTRGSKVYVPSNNIASIWVAPVVGKVTGTLVVSNGSATFTATNFSETRSGVTKDPLTPAFNVITKIRPMTAGEYKANCVNPSAGNLGNGAPKGKSLPSPALARVKRGQTQAQVLRELGRPLVERFTTKSCRLRDVRCNAIGGRGGTWVYRDVAVVFGANHRVSALIYSTHGHRRMVMA
jgi:hypothetical protein